MRYPLVNVPRRQILMPRLGGLSDDYAANVSNFKNLLSKQNQAAQQKYEQEHAGEPVYHPPQYPSSNEPGAQGCAGEPGCQGKPGEPDTREARDFSREGAVGPEANLPPPAPPISVYGGDEVPPPVPMPPQTPGGHAPVVTGIPNWADRYSYPTAPPMLPPLPETSACGPGYTRTVPGGPCVKNTPTEETYGAGCYKCPDGSMKWTGSPGAGCTPTGYDEATCRSYGGGGEVSTLPSSGTTPPPPPPGPTKPTGPDVASGGEAGMACYSCGGSLRWGYAAPGCIQAPYDKGTCQAMSHAPLTGNPGGTSPEGTSSIEPNITSGGESVSSFMSMGRAFLGKVRLVHRGW